MQKILVIRNDKLGDFMLSWPSLAMLKNSLPNCSITVLVPAYTAELASICPYIDDIIIDHKNGSKEEQAQTLASIKQKRFDVSINLFSDRYNAFLVWRAKIPYRLAPATKIIQFLYNRRVIQRRSKSLKPEYQYNLDLIRAFLKDKKVKIIEPHPPYLHFSIEQIDRKKEQLGKTLNLSLHKKWIFLHPGNGGSATNLTLLQYAQLIRNLYKEIDCQIILTAGPSEKEKVEELYELTGLNQEDIKIYVNTNGLVDFAYVLSCADLFIASSTGPLHLAAALNTLTVGFFPSKRSASSLRWQPINQLDYHLSFSPDSHHSEKTEMQSIDIISVTEKILFFLRQHWNI